MRFLINHLITFCEPGLSSGWLTQDCTASNTQNHCLSMTENCGYFVTAWKSKNYNYAFHFISLKLRVFFRLRGSSLAVFLVWVWGPFNCDN